MDHFIEINNLVKIYGKGKSEAALEGITINFQKGVLNVIVGPSGSGKTTLLNCIGGLLRPSSGKININNWLISLAPIKELIDFRRKRVGFIFQDHNLIPGLTVEENIALPAFFSKSNSRSIKEKINQLLTQLEISALKNVDISNLSGGEKQRVGIAAALINNPELLIADEPTGQLDPKNTKILTEILHSQAKNGKCVLVATHDPRVAKEADTIFRLTRTEILQVTLDKAFTIE